MEEALQLGYPKDLFYKLEERRARCLLALKRHDAAIEAFRRALQTLDDARISLERKQKFEADIRMMLAVMDKGKQLNKIAPNNLSRVNNKPSLSSQRSQENRGKFILEKQRNPRYPACNSAVEIKDNGGDVGRHAVATREIVPGEIIIVERPHCAFLLAENRFTHCHLCFARIFVPVPCRTCSCIIYCSRRCRDADAQVHLRECKLLPILWRSKASVTCFLALRAITQKSLEEIMKLKKQLVDSGSALNISAKNPYRGNDYMTFYNLVTHEDKRLPEDLFHRAYMAAWLFRLLKTSEYLPESMKTADTAHNKLSNEELFIAELLLHNLQLLQFNSHEISELIKPKGEKTLSKAKSIFIGGGVYPTVAMLNHSCNPGVIRYFIGTTMVVRAARTIRAGEEISENYGPIFTTTPENERKRRLRVQYWFDCNCEACSGHWPLLEELDPTILRFKCETGLSCGNVLLVRSDTNEFMIGCAKCGKSTNILKGLRALQDTDALFKVASMNLEEGKNELALKANLDILKLLDETLALPIRDYHICQQGVRLCALALGNTAYI
ncbi:SET and MYND domain-containing protein 4 isoform X2 [Camponotus floridanus]|nr:SET and MYND domain-containing protein 4 isoform X2 [Camponotus floridanus]